ncbi:hypothetical protein MTR_2g461860 [Medicago truncatula]|uniref:Uncharacterized protein n=1 Tax=Medicago truncatula TaxID=3880 RepID=A0A072V7U7_MEDTR|nr:hypothetical protein MTR_2g461860 [Medicago truncatula]
MCDLGASVSFLKSTRMTLQLADRFIIYPTIILEDIPIKVGKIYIPTDFVVVDIEEDSQILILLERPFLGTAGAVIDVKNECFLASFAHDDPFDPFLRYFYRQASDVKRALCGRQPIEHQAPNFNDYAWTQQQMQQQPTTSTTSTTTYNFNDIDDNSGNDNNNNDFAS